MSKLHGQIVQTVKQLVKQIKINRDIVQVSVYLEVKRLDKNKFSIKSDLYKLTEEDILCNKLANKS